MDRLKGAVAGVIGGLAGSFAMSEFHAVWSRAVHGYQSRSASDGRDWQDRSEDDNANQQIAQTIATRTLGRSLDANELVVAAPIVHYVVGGAMGALYGLAAERSRHVCAAGGAVFGFSVWIGADELAMPLVGLEGPPNDRGLELHTQALAAHVVYGMTTEFVRSMVRRSLG